MHKASPRYILTQVFLGLDSNGFPDSILLHQQKKIKCTIYEADLRLNSKDGDWGMGIHWSVLMLQKVLPDELFARIQEAQVDLFRPAPESDFVPIINGDTGEEVKSQESLSFYVPSIF